MVAGAGVMGCDGIARCSGGSCYQAQIVEADRARGPIQRVDAVAVASVYDNLLILARVKVSEGVAARERCAGDRSQVGGANLAVPVAPQFVQAAGCVPVDRSLDTGERMERHRRCPGGCWCREIG